MIVRIWHGRTARSVADEYAGYLERMSVPRYRALPGNLDAAILRRDEGDVTHFLAISRWVSEDAIRAWAGDDVLKIKYNPEDTGYLLEFEPDAQHYTVVARGP